LPVNIHTKEIGMDLSIITPLVNEHPQIRFTLQSLASSLLSSGIEYEIIVINNYCEKVAEQGFPEDKGWDALTSLHQEKRTKGLVLATYTEKLSHWNAKNVGIKLARGDTLFFCDAHVLVGNDTLPRMYEYLHKNTGPLDTVHLPIRYMNDREDRNLLYRMRVNPGQGLLHYVFHHMKVPENIDRIEVPVMSTCGMMCRRQLMLDLDGWPGELGIYGGGENYINYVLSVLGGRKFIFREVEPIYHFAEKRQYHYEWEDWLRNRLIAIYLAGGTDWVQKCAQGIVFAKKAAPRVVDRLLDEVLSSSRLEARRASIAAKSKISLDEWVKSWEDTQYYEEIEGWV
jgi:glycosyltransferase involved in cell wall biosynthesis